MYWVGRRITGIRICVNEVLNWVTLSIVLVINLKQVMINWVLWNRAHALKRQYGFLQRRQQLCYFNGFALKNASRVDALVYLPIEIWLCQADTRFAPSQWETALLCNDVSHWLGLGASQESTLYLHHYARCGVRRFDTFSGLDVVVENLWPRQVLGISVTWNKIAFVHYIQGSFYACA